MLKKAKKQNLKKRRSKKASFCFFEAKEKQKSKKAKKQKAAFCCCHDCPLYINVTMPSSSIFSLDNMVKHTLRKVPRELQVKSHIFSWFTRGWKLLCTKTASKRCQYWRFSTTTGGISILTTTIDPQGPY